MKRIEIIRLRLAQCNYDDVLGMLWQLLGGLDNPDIQIYRQATVETDIAIHLNIESSISDSAVSETALHLASSLKELGLVNLSVWVEIDGNEMRKLETGART